MNVPIRALKDRLSEYLRRVEAGETVVVTDHGRPVAEIVRVDMERLGARQRLERMVAEGDVTAPKGRGFARVRPSRVRGRAVSSTLVEDRR